MKSEKAGPRASDRSLSVDRRDPHAAGLCAFPFTAVQFNAAVPPGCGCKVPVIAGSVSHLFPQAIVAALIRGLNAFARWVGRFYNHSCPGGRVRMSWEKAQGFTGVGSG